MADYAIKLDNVTKIFSMNSRTFRFVIDRFLPYRFQNKNDDLIVLEDISFEIKKGEFLGIIGKNGCGKSTLMKLIAGIYEPNWGKIEVNGTVAPFLELGIGFKPDLNAIDNIYLNGAILGMSRAFLKGKIDEILDFAGIADFANQQIRFFSSGMRIRLAFAIAIQSKADIYLLDEVMAVGDAQFKKKSMDKMKELISKDCTVVMTSHNATNILENATSAIYINNGKIVYKGDPEKCLDAYSQNV